MHPILFSIGPVAIHSYGLMLGLAFLATMYLSSRRASIFDLSGERVSNLIILFLVSGIVGARIAYVLANMSLFLDSPLEILMINKGGLIFYGGFIFALVAGIVYAMVTRLAILDTADLMAPFIALGHSIGRVGCFFNGCCYGRPTDSFLGVCFPDTLVRVYPTQLFSSAGLLAIFFLLFFFQSRRRFKGEIISLYFILYGAFRFLIEFLRGDSAEVLLGFTSAQIISIIFVAVGIILFVLMKRVKR